MFSYTCTHICSLLIVYAHSIKPPTQYKVMWGNGSLSRIPEPPVSRLCSPGTTRPLSLNSRVTTVRSLMLPADTCPDVLLLPRPRLCHTQNSASGLCVHQRPPWISTQRAPRSFLQWGHTALCRRPALGRPNPSMLTGIWVVPRRLLFKPGCHRQPCTRHSHACTGGIGRALSPGLGKTVHWTPTEIYSYRNRCCPPEVTRPPGSEGCLSKEFIWTAT